MTTLAVLAVFYVLVGLVIVIADGPEGLFLWLSQALSVVYGLLFWPVAVIMRMFVV